MADIMIKEVRLSFPTLFTAQEFKAGDGRPRWSASFLVEPGSANDKLIEAEIEAEAKATYGAKWQTLLKQYRGQKNQDCYKDGDLSEYEGYEGMKVLSSHRSAKLRNGSANSRPIIIDRDKSPLTADDPKPYAGCYVNAKVSIYCQKGENPGIRASFSVIQFVKDGDAFAAGTPSADDFDDLAEGADAESLV